MKPIVSIIMGSTSDLPVMEKAAKLLDEMQVPFEMNALSAHRTPAEVEKFAKEAAGRGIKVIIAAAGMAAALPGVIAANTTLPVIGVPVKGSVLDGVDAIYGQHIWAGLEAPYLNVQPGVRMASCDNFTITVEGSSTHGSTPHLGTDAIVAAASIIMNIQTIVSRNNDPLNALVVSIGEIHGGQRFNILANKVVMEGTCRTHSREMRGKIEPLLRRICEDTAAAFGAKAELKYDAFPSPVINDHDDLNQIAHDAAVKLYGEEGIKEMPRVMGSEDFAYFMDVVPGIFGFLGSRDAEHQASNHNDCYDVPEDVLKRGAAMHAQFAADYLSAKAPK